MTWHLRHHGRHPIDEAAEGRRVSTPRRPSPADPSGVRKIARRAPQLSRSVNGPPHESNDLINGREPRSQSGSASP